MFAKSAIAAFALSAAAVKAFDVLQPSTDVWWLEASVNNMVWNCHDSDVLPMYTVFVVNSKVFTDRVPIISQLDNSQCSHQITEGEVVGVPVGTGYVLQFTDPLNNTKIVGQSQEFEVKAKSAGYSSVTATPRSGAAATSGSGSGSSTSGGAAAGQTNTPSGSAIRVGSSLAALAAAALGAAVML
ncbi:hypothetical protein BKA62DRAFT_683031 [Auriculariales sp. MPI-PUGE-AT-0066]|nr:hypothetical protein BKA62DRAFT_683031 [Auriculariales sp. MPI-PUGE-AT-0066]